MSAEGTVWCLVSIGDHDGLVSQGNVDFQETALVLTRLNFYSHLVFPCSEDI